MRRPVGVITRGTTNPNRLRRVDRYICNQSVLRQTESPLVVDLGFGANPTTTIELLERLRKVNDRTKVLGIEIDRERVVKAKPFETKDLLFTLGGFEIPIPEPFGNQATLIRAMNVLRQYDESEVADAWQLLQQRIAPNGLIVEGTCDEIGRLASWVTLDKTGPISLTLSFRLLGLDQPSKVAERLPKALIHKNTAGNNIHDFLSELDRAWLNNSSLSVFSPVQRFTACAEELEKSGWPISHLPKRWKLGELTIDWKAVSSS
ncbi:MAG: class I SAM-dependent methyltransferase [Micrococcales bacterium]|nr:class I SAM-dependent methyltransferase [Micrococcales bacterium]